MKAILMTAAMILSSGLRASAGLFELPIATTEAGILNFWPRLNASCEMKPLQDNLCCLDSTFKGSSDAHHLLVKLLKKVPDPKYEVEGVAQLLHETSNGLDVGARYTCDVPLAQDGNKIPGLGCHKCLQAIAREITDGMSQNLGRCANAWAVRFGSIYEPDIPWEEDTTWCHLDYWFSVLPTSNPPTRFWNTLLRELLTRARSWLRENYLTYFVW